MNIPRYIEALDEDIRHDVDAHLYGGIPLRQVEKLTVLHDMTKEVLYAACKEIRPNYVELTKDLDSLSEEILAHDSVVQQRNALGKAVNLYAKRYWESLKEVADVHEIQSLKEDMLAEMKNMLKAFPHVSTYAGYQIIAELWEEMLLEDTEKIALSDFYTIAKTREPHMVTRGSGRNKRREQDGWLGAIVPNELILQQLYQEEVQALEAKKEAFAGIQEEIAELAEAANVEEREEADILGEALNARGDDFTATAIRAELKQADKETDAYDLLEKVSKLLDEKTSLNRAIREKEKELATRVEEKIEELTETEIDQLMYTKWFGSLQDKLTNLIDIPLKKEIDTLQSLQERYADTLETIEAESKSLEAEFEAMVKELVVTE